MSFVERVNQGESLASWFKWLTEPPAVCWSVIMGDLSASCKGDTGPFQRLSERAQEAVLCTACFSTWISNHMPSKVWDEITYPFSNFNVATVEVWELITNYAPQFIMDVLTYPTGIKLNPHLKGPLVVRSASVIMDLVNFTNKCVKYVYYVK